MVIFISDNASFLCELYLYTLFSGTNKCISAHSLAAKKKSLVEYHDTVSNFWFLVRGIMQS